MNVSEDDGQFTKRRETLGGFPSFLWALACQEISQSGDRISKGFCTKNEALAWIQLVKMKMDQGITIRGESTTLNEFLRSWIETRKSSLRPKTLHQYTSLISHYILPSIGHIKLCQLNIKKGGKLLF